MKTNKRKLFRTLLAAALVATIGGALPAGEALAQRLIQVGQAKRTATVSVYIGKSEDVRTDTSFVELTVGDPEVADVNPLTDKSLSILGKKNGTTRVSVCSTQPRRATRPSRQSMPTAIASPNSATASRRNAGRSCAAKATVWVAGGRRGRARCLRRCREDGRRRRWSGRAP